MIHVLCLAEQQDQAAFKLLPATVTVTARPLGDLVREGWERPLILLGEGLTGPYAPRLLQRAYRNPAPLLVLPPLPVGEVTSMLDAPAPVTIVRQRADGVELTDDALKEAIGRDRLQIHCTEAVETALRTGTLAMAGDRPVIWAYRPTRASTPVVWVAPQLLLVSARSDPLDREDLLAALLAWAEAQTRTDSAREGAEGAKPEATEVEPGILRAVVVAWAVRPDLTQQTLPGWLQTRLSVVMGDATLDAALAALRREGALDVEDRPQQERLGELVDAWSLRAWVREARRMDEEMSRRDQDA
jgi:hypothetical protein